MRVPSYRREAEYRYTPAQPVHLSGPVWAASGGKRYDTMSAAGGMLHAVYALPHALKRTGEAFKSSGENWPFLKSDEKAADFLEGRVCAQADPDGAYSGFSSPSRGALLRFGREQLFAASAGAGRDPLEKLDEYFGKTVGKQISDAAYQAQHDLLSQDYVVLRREIAHLQQKQHNAQAKASFENGAGSFVQTAGLIRSPRVLEQYLQNNLQAAETEALQTGFSEQAWQGQKERLYTEAVLHNINAALAAAEPAQARAAYEYFKHKLPEAQQTLAEEKIAFCEGEDLAEKLCLQLTQHQAPPAQIEKWIVAHVPQENVRPAVKAALEAKLALHQRKQHRRQARLYGTLLQSGAESLPAVLSGSFATQEDLHWAAQAVQSWQQQADQSSVAEEFLRLQNAVWNGEDCREQLRKSFEKGRLSGRDYLCLSERTHSSLADGADAAEKWLFRAVQTWCRRQELTEEECHLAGYYVFSGSGGIQEHVTRAQELKHIFELQENKK